MPCSRYMPTVSERAYDGWMTDAEKLADYARIVEIIEDRIALERHFIRSKSGWDAIESMRADAYSEIVDAIFGLGTLRKIQKEEEAAGE
jgi:hypothetical protein